MRIRVAVPSEARACAALIADAMLRDPVGIRALPMRRARRERLALLYEAELRSGAFDRGIVLVAEHDDHLVGVAAWEVPHRRRRLRAIVRQLPRYALAIGLAPACAAARAATTRRRARPAQPHWLLADIAVAECARGHGIGAALLARGLEHRGAAVYLEATTPASRRLYERFGFVARTAIDLAPGGYPIGMWRAAAPMTT